MVNELNVSKYSTSRNPVQGLWNIGVLYGFHPDYPRRVYAVQFTSLIGDRDSITKLENFLHNYKSASVEELNLSGVLESRVFPQVLNHITYLKSQDEIERVDSLLPYLDPDEGEIEAQKLYDQLVDAICSDPERFPTISSCKYKRGESDGVILDASHYMSKYGLRDGVGAVGVTTEFVKEILGFDETRGVSYLQTTGSWHEHGYIMKRNKGKRRQDFLQPCADREDEQRFFVLRIPDLQARFTQTADDREELDHE